MNWFIKLQEKLLILKNEIKDTGRAYFLLYLHALNQFRYEFAKTSNGADESSDEVER